MSLALPFSEEQRDCLQEITNVAMGAAAESLAEMTHTFVCLPIPDIRYVDTNTFLESLGGVKGCQRMSSVSQMFKFSSINGYALIVINDESLSDLANCTGHSIEDENQVRELLQQLCNTINKTCFERFGEMLEENPETQMPSVHDLRVPFESIQVDDLSRSHSLVTVEINYHIENHPFNCDLLLMFPEETLPELTQALDRLM